MKLQAIIDKPILDICTLFSFFLLYCPAYGQCEIEESRQVIYRNDTSELNYVEYMFRNTTQDTVYLWVDTDTVDNDSLSSIQKNFWLFYKYIRAPKCELGLDFLCHDGNIDFSKGYPAPVIGCTFIKKILPDESFTIITLNGGLNKGAIHHVQKKIVSHFFQIERLDKFCYNKPFVIVW